MAGLTTMEVWLFYSGPAENCPLQTDLQYLYPRVNPPCILELSPLVGIRHNASHGDLSNPP